jgi:hypothetical protein
LSAWSAFGAGIGVSIAANVAHTWYPSAAALRAWRAGHGPAAAWHPSPIAALSAAFWPIALLLCIEIVTRVSWPLGVRWSLARYGGTGLVAVVAAVVSYRHMAGLLAAVGEDGLTSAIGPLAVDGLMAVASVALLSMATGHRDGDTPAAVTVPATPTVAGQLPEPPADDSAGITGADPAPAALPSSVPSKADTTVSAEDTGRRLSKKERAARLLRDAPPMPEERLAAWLAEQLDVTPRYGRQLRTELAASHNGNGRSAGHD